MTLYKDHGSFRFFQKDNSGKEKANASTIYIRHEVCESVPLADPKGYTPEQIDASLGSEITYGSFFIDAPAYNPRSGLIRGKICGIQVETIDDPLMKKIRQLDKLVDELAKGKAMEKILR